jgi:hypothetical protein
MTRQVRDYNDVIRRLERVRRDDISVQEVAEVWGYPWFLIERAGKLPTVLLTAGMHGEEPGGVEGVLQWAESGEWRRWRVNWLIFPCINPYGWERNYRRNRQRRDINRQFRTRTDTKESELIKRIVRGRRFLFSMEFHEDVDAAGYYLYELRRQPPFIGEQVVRAVSKVIHINRDTVIDGNEATGEGLIRRVASVSTMRQRRQWPMAYHLFRHCTNHVLGSETPVTVPLKQRARAHVVALQTALKLTQSSAAC